METLNDKAIIRKECASLSKLVNTDNVRSIEYILFGQFTEYIIHWEFQQERCKVSVTAMHQNELEKVLSVLERCNNGLIAFSRENETAEAVYKQRPSLLQIASDIRLVNDYFGAVDHVHTTIEYTEERRCK